MKEPFLEVAEVIGEAFEFLDNLRMSGQMNMFGAAPELVYTFGVTKKQAVKVLEMWMESKCKSQ